MQRESSINSLHEGGPPTETIQRSLVSGRRDPAIVMRLQRLGSFHQSRLSFMRIFTRRMQRERWTFSRTACELDSEGVGHAVYTLAGPENCYSLVAFSHAIDDEQRSDRVIATAWDATFVLYDGIPDASAIARLADNVPLQEAGRLSTDELTLSRANRSVRLWQYVVECLSAGRQPEPQRLAEVGYLMRTTAVYGSGKFGAVDREFISERAEFAEPFQAEMMSVYLIRQFVRDLVDHMALMRGGIKAVSLQDSLARLLGIGNSTGLGMAPFLINHPRLFNNWIMVREEALRRVLALPEAGADAVSLFVELVARVERSVSAWRTEHPVQIEKIQGLRRDLILLRHHLDSDVLNESMPWKSLYEWVVKTLDTEAQECVVSLLYEPYPELVDGLGDCLSDTTTSGVTVDGRMNMDELKTLLRQHYDWALAIDWSRQESTARAWYVSEEKLEPRLGERFEEEIADYEQPLAPARDACALFRCIASMSKQTTVAELLLKHPEHRQSVQRAQLLTYAPYAEIRDNTICASVVPFDLLRCKLSFFGATHFDPRSDRWLRISLYAHAPYPHELQHCDADRWVYPDIS